MNEKTVTCLNGRLVPAELAMLPVTDRGFRFGDGVFETIRLEAGVPYQWEEHLARLESGIAALRIDAHGIDWRAAARDVIAHNRVVDGFLRLSISRGVGSRGYMPDAAITANWVVEYVPPVTPATEPYRLTIADFTRPPLSALPVNHKLAHGIGSTLALMEARDQQCDEAIILSADAKLCELASANLFWIAAGKIYTPALSTGCVAGTTRAALLRLAPSPVQEVVADSGALHGADALFLTNVRLGVWPATSKKFKIMDSQYHPLVKECAARLVADRASYTQLHKASWA